MKLSTRSSHWSQRDEHKEDSQMAVHSSKCPMTTGNKARTCDSGTRDIGERPNARTPTAARCSKCLEIALGAAGPSAVRTHARTHIHTCAEL